MNQKNAKSRKHEDYISLRPGVFVSHGSNSNRDLPDRLRLSINIRLSTGLQFPSTVKLNFPFSMELNKSRDIQEQKETLRIETFSDGVFCIAVTLLSIEIGVEIKNDMKDKDLLHALWEKWPICLAYVISFINVLLAWIGHHSLFKMLRRSDNAIMISNGFLLMLVALVPFPTKTLGMFLQSDALKTAVIFYTGYFVLISLAFRLLWHAAANKRERLIPSITDKQIKQTTRNENIGLICNATIMAVAFINPVAALVLSFGMWVYWIVFA